MSQSKVIGLIGGLSWESSAVYYRILNQAVQARLGGTHSARCLMWSFDFSDVEELQSAGRWDLLTVQMVEAARQLERASAGFLVICSNTMHLVAEDVAAAVSIPLLHMVDTTARHLRSLGVRRVALLGTRFTMEDPGYREHLATCFGGDVLIPAPDDRATVHRIIFDELVKGRLESSSRDHFRAIMARLVDDGAEAIILGCTEIGLLVGSPDSTVPMIDTLELHALAAVELALAP